MHFSCNWRAAATATVATTLFKTMCELQREISYEFIELMMVTIIVITLGWLHEFRDARQRRVEVTGKPLPKRVPSPRITSTWLYSCLGNHSRSEFPTADSHLREPCGDSRSSASRVSKLLNHCWAIARSTVCLCMFWVQVFLSQTLWTTGLLWLVLYNIHLSGAPLRWRQGYNLEYQCEIS